MRGVCVEHFLLGEPLVAALRGAGLSVTTGAINHAAIAERALAHAPDALTTDRPHGLAAELLERRLLAADQRAAAPGCLISPSRACR